MLRSQLMSRIHEMARGITPAKGAKCFGITQPCLNRVLRGEIDEFSVDALINMMVSAGLRVQLRVRTIR